MAGGSGRVRAREPRPNQRTWRLPSGCLKSEPVVNEFPQLHPQAFPQFSRGILLYTFTGSRTGGHREVFGI